MSDMFAKYTETFFDFNKTYPSFLIDNLAMSTTERTEKLVNALKSVYNLYEIGGETEQTFMIMFMDTFNTWKDYYEERITAYEKQYDYTVGNRRRTIKTSGINTTGTQNTNSSSNNKHTDIELPNKQVTFDYEGYPNAISKDDSTDENSRAYDSNTTLNDEVTTYFDDEFLDLKKKYLDQIRNIYLEFANKFKECFILIY